MKTSKGLSILFSGLLWSTLSCEPIVGGTADVGVTQSAVVTTPEIVLGNFTDGFGWTLPQYYQTIQYPDITGDSRSDVCGRGGGGIWCATDPGDGSLRLVNVSLWSSAFSDAAYWNQPQYYTTLRFPQLNGTTDTKADVCARGSDGIHCALSNGTTGFTDSLGRIGGTDVWDGGFFSDANGWASDPKYYKTIQFADINGDGNADVCGRRSDGIYCALSNGKTAFGPVTLWNGWFSDARHWGDNEKYYSTIKFVDLNGDGAADVCGRDHDGIRCAISDTTGAFRTLSVDTGHICTDKFAGGNMTADLWSGFFSDANHWDTQDRYSTIGYPGLNMTNDSVCGATLSTPSVCGHGADGMHCAERRGALFTNLAGTPNQTDDWNVGGLFGADSTIDSNASYYQTLQYPAHLSDFGAGVCVRMPNGIQCVAPANTPGQFATVSMASIQETDPVWQDPKYYTTISITPDFKICERTSAGIACSASSAMTEEGPWPFLYGASVEASNGYDGPNPTLHGAGTWAPRLTLPSGGGGGPLMPPSGTVTVQPVIWPQSVCGATSGTPTQTSAQISNFYNVITHSQFLGWLQNEYGLANVIANSPLTVNLFHTNPAPLNTNPPCGQPITDAQIQQGLAALLAAGPSVFGSNTAATAPSTIFALHFPANMLPVGTPLGNGYNASATLPGGAVVHYLVITGNGLNALTQLESHELLENLSDPFNGSGWRLRSQSTYNPNVYGADSGSMDFGNTQIADACEGINQTISCVGSTCSGATPVSVQGMWSNAQNSCMISLQGASNDLGQGVLAGYTGASGIVLAGTPTNYMSMLVSNKSRDVNIFGGLTSSLDDAAGPFETWETKAGTRFVSGDFNGDGFGDVALLVPNECTVPVATRGATSAPYHVMNGKLIDSPVPSRLKGVVNTDLTPCWFQTLLTQSPQLPLTGDFNGDGLTDVALVGGSWSGGVWGSIPVMFSAGQTTNAIDERDAFWDGNVDFWTTNNPDSGFNAAIVNASGTKKMPPAVVTADFNGDGLTDIALVGGLTSGGALLTTVKVAFSIGDGTFNVQDIPIDYMTTAITGPPTLAATSDPNGWVYWPGGTQAVGGDFNNDGLGDIALMAMPGTGAGQWGSIPVLFGTGSGPQVGVTSPRQLTRFVVANRNTADATTFAQNASNPGMQLLAGDYDGDGATDLAVMGPSMNQVTVAFSTANRFSQCGGTNCGSSPSLGVFQTVLSQSFSGDAQKMNNLSVTALSGSSGKHQ